LAIKNAFALNFRRVRGEYRGDFGVRAKKLASAVALNAGFLCNGQWH
jgi:hypothetical protein